MFVWLSKTADVLLSPLGWAIILALAAGLVSLLAPSRRRLAATLALVSAALLYVFSTAAASNACMRLAERSAVRTASESGRYEAVILLGGMVDEPVRLTHGQMAYTEANERLLQAFAMLREDRAQYVLIAAGMINPSHTQSEAETLGRQLEQWGIDRGRIVLETSSRNTRENALNSASIIAKYGWTKLVLITSAFHMKRALGCFHQVGVHPDAWPVDYRSNHTPVFDTSLLPRSDALDLSAIALREMAGRLVYQLSGYTP